MNVCVAKVFNVQGFNQDLAICKCSHELQATQSPANADVFSGSELSSSCFNHLKDPKLASSQDP